MDNLETTEKTTATVGNNTNSCEAMHLNGRDKDSHKRTNDFNSEQEPKRKKNRGQFKNRFKSKKKTSTELSICSTLIDIPENIGPTACEKVNCTGTHNIEEYLEHKLPDIGSVCYVYSLKGHCRRGLTCRYGKHHLTSEGWNRVDKQRVQDFESEPKTVSYIKKELQIELRKRNYNFDKSQNIMEQITKNKVEAKLDSDKLNENKIIGTCSEEDLYPLRIEEKRKIDWKNKLYLSPLTTLGNLPFRRICKEFGADVTCSEMAMATSILKGLHYECALLQKHDTEDLFGIQICGNNPHVMTRCAQVLEENTQADFIDINMGCPIDAVYKMGAGSGLMRRENVLHTVVQGMSRVLSLPLTVKIRTGVYDDKPIAHKLIPKFKEAGVSLVTVHGRSREQRYTKTSDWAYINQCAQVADPLPVFGNGDILSYHDYQSMRANYESISGAMIGRGALCKPWIFTEIKEQRDWDISPPERLDFLKKYVNYGLDHWGSDTKGVEITRRFLLEWLSFLYRYVPVGLLDQPQKINERPEKYIGRNDLETLMASPNCANWIKISEMLLGPVPTDFSFLPKHKANAWSE